MSDEPAKNGKFDWRVHGITIVLVVGGWLVQWGISSATLAEHERRITLIEKSQQEKYLTRDEFERRHEDLKGITEDNRERIQKIEEDRLADLQRRAK